MLKAIKQLLIVQDRDVTINQLKQDLENIPKEIEHEKKLFKQAQAKLEELKQTHKKREVDMGKVQLDRRTRQDTILKLKTQQFETRKNEEFAAMGVEIDNYTREVDRLETEELELMEGVEAAQQEVNNAKDALQKKYDHLREFAEELKKKSITHKQRIEEIIADRKKLAAEIEKGPLETYERVYKSKGDVAIVLMEHGSCTGCHMKVIQGTAVKAQGSSEICHCENCGRILYTYN